MVPFGGIIRGKAGVKLDKSVEKDRTIGIACVGVLGILQGNYRGVGEGGVGQ